MKTSWYFAAATVALVAVGCLRPVLPEPLRSHWSGLVLGLSTVALLLGALRSHLRARRSESGPEDWLVALLPLALAAMYLQPQRIASDGIFYYTPLHSIVVDHDLDFENEYRVLGAEPGYFQRTVTGRLPNNYSVGPALLWAPFFLVAHTLGIAGIFRPTGFGYPYFTFVTTGTVLVGFAGVVALFRLVREYFPPPVAFTAVLLTWLATFHVWYMTFEPSMSHAQAMASVSIYLLATHRGVKGYSGFALMGGLGGLVALVRWQNVVFLPVTLVVTWLRYGRPRPRELACGAVAFLIVFSPQLLYWKLLYGSFLLVPQGGGYIDWTSPEIEGLVFSSRHGLLSWAPVLYLALAGIPGFVRREPVLGWGLVLSGAAVVWVNGSVYDWWAGASFGSRRFDGALPAFTLGLAVFLQWLAPKIAARPLFALGVGLLPFVLWNVVLMGVYFTGAIPPDGPASFRRAVGDGADLLYPRFGYPFSWPASMIRHWRDGIPLSSYDLIGADAPSNNLDIRMGDTDALFLGRGWSLPLRGRDVTSREVSAVGGEIVVSLFERAPYVVDVWGRSGGRVSLAWNGEAVSELALSGDTPVSAEVASSRVEAGTNVIVFTPLGEDRAFVSRVRLTRPGDF